MTLYSPSHSPADFDQSDSSPANQSETNRNTVKQSEMCPVKGIPADGNRLLFNLKIFDIATKRIQKRFGYFRHAYEEYELRQCEKWNIHIHLKFYVISAQKIAS